MTRRTLTRLTLRQRVMAATGLAVFCAATLLTAGATYMIDSALDADASRTLEDRAAAALSTMSVTNGLVDVEDPPSDSHLDRATWIYADGKAMRSGLASADVAQQVDSLSTVSAPTTVELPEAHTLVRAVPFISDGRQYGTVVATLSLLPYEQTEHLAGVVLAGFGLIVVAASVALAAILVGVALRPVAHMTTRAAAWSDSGVDNRFPTNVTKDEIGRLAATLNGLLDRLRASSLHEQRFTAEIAHELRTPLTTLLNEVAVAGRHASTLDDARAALDSIESEALRMAAIIDTLMAIAERDADHRAASCELSEVLSETSENWRARAADEGKRLTVTHHSRMIRVGVDAGYLVRIMSPIVDNAIRHARTLITIDYRIVDAVVEIGITDDGPGLPDGMIEAVFDPGVRGPDQQQTRGGGLGLPLARRLARNVAGDVTGEAGVGATLVIRLPVLG